MNYNDLLGGNVCEARQKISDMILMEMRFISFIQLLITNISKRQIICHHCTKYLYSRVNVTLLYGGGGGYPNFIGGKGGGKS